LIGGSCGGSVLRRPLSQQQQTKHSDNGAIYLTSQTRPCLRPQPVGSLACFSRVKFASHFVFHMQ